MTKEEIIPADIYTRDYYLCDNEGHVEYQNLDACMHDKFERALRLADIKPGEKVLDLGCGRGELLYYAIQRGALKALGLDYSRAAIEIARETIQRLPPELQGRASADVSTVEDYQYQDKYDVIFFLEIAEHMHDWQLKDAFRLFNQILTDQGRIIMITPNYLYENVLQPVKLWLHLPLNFIKVPSRMIRGKFKPKSFGEFWSKVFRVRIDRGERNRRMHCNVLTPNRIRELLADFDARVYCEDHSRNPIAMMFKANYGRDIVAIAKKKP